MSYKIRLPAYAPPAVFGEIASMSRRAVYEAIARGDLIAVKRGTATLINVERGLAWIASLPPAQVKLSPHDRGKQAQQQAMQSAQVAADAQQERKAQRKKPSRKPDEAAA